MGNTIDLGALLTNREYFLDLYVRMAHHSTAIEGNTLSLDETASIILNDFIPRAINDREFYEVRNYKLLLPHFVEKLKNKVAIDNELIKFFHSFIMRDLHEQAGVFKKLDNAIIGAEFDTAKPYLVPTLLKEMCNNLYFRLERASNDSQKLEAIFEAHIAFERIHPFSDGNGRTGRLLIIYSCLENNLVPIVIPKKYKASYIAYLRSGTMDAEMLDFIQDIQAKELLRIRKFT